MTVIGALERTAFFSPSALSTTGSAAAAALVETGFSAAFDAGLSALRADARELGLADLDDDGLDAGFALDAGAMLRSGLDAGSRRCVRRAGRRTDGE